MTRATTEANENCFYRMLLQGFGRAVGRALRLPLNGLSPFVSFVLFVPFVALNGLSPVVPRSWLIASRLLCLLCLLWLIASRLLH